MINLDITEFGGKLCGRVFEVWLDDHVIVCEKTMEDALVETEHLLRVTLDTVQARLTAERERVKS